MVVSVTLGDRSRSFVPGLSCVRVCVCVCVLRGMLSFLQHLSGGVNRIPI